MSTMIKQLQEKRAGLHAQATKLIRNEDGTARSMSAEDRSKFDEIHKDMADIKEDIDRIEKSEKVERELAEPRGSRSGDPHPEPIGDPNLDPELRKLEVEARTAELKEKQAKRKAEEAEKAYRSAWTEYLSVPRAQAEEKERAMRPKFQAWKEARDQQAGTQSISYTQGSAGGYFVPAGFVYDVEVALKYFFPFLDGTAVRILETATGQVLPYPTCNDTGVSGALMGEATQANEADVTLGVVNFGAWKFTTGIVRVSLELLQDSAFNLQDFLKEQFAIRIGRAYETYFTNGTGTNQPNGIITAVLASGVSPTIATGSSTNDGTSATGANSIGTNDLVSLEHALDPLYRRGAKFMCHDFTVRQIKQLLDKYGRPIWLPGIGTNAPDTILGYPYVVNQSFPTVAATKNTMLFGKLDKFIVRKVKDLQVLRLDERYADFGEVGYVGFTRADSQLIDAGTHPVVVLQQHS